MIIIGERINSSRKKVAEAIQRRNGDFLLEEAKRQIEAGADYLDVNSATSLEKEVDDLEWLVSFIQSRIDIPLCIDSPNPEAISAGLAKHKGRAFVNSVSLEAGRAEKILPLVKKYNAYIVGLTMDERGIPKTARERLEIAKRLCKVVTEYGINKDDLYIDPLVRPISSESGQGREFLEAVRLIKEAGLKVIGGLSNISYGLPRRDILNAVFLAMAMECGIDAAIVDPTDKFVASALYASGALVGKDRYCMKYIKAFREGKLL